jgi:hypothetical protein
MGGSGSAAEEIHDPENKGESHAEKNAGDDRKIKAAVAAVVGDVAGKAAEAERKFRTGEKESTRDDEDNAYDKEHFAKFADGIRRIHGKRLEGRVGWTSKLRVF